MISSTIDTKWRERGLKALSAVVVVTCYLIVFAGLVALMAGRSP